MLAQEMRILQNGDGRHGHGTVSPFGRRRKRDEIDDIRDDAAARVDSDTVNRTAARTEGKPTGRTIRKKRNSERRKKDGGRWGIRTPGLSDANAALSQLS